VRSIFRPKREDILFCNYDEGDKIAGDRSDIYGYIILVRKNVKLGNLGGHWKTNVSEAQVRWGLD
jgi:hypothetical protein